MKVWRIYRFGRLICEINGSEEALLKWIQNNVKAPTDSGIRRGDVNISKYRLYEDARFEGYTINSRK